MELRSLTNFCKIAEAGGLTAAARDLQLSQAALSRQLALLEQSWTFACSNGLAEGWY